jgi:hypothetical protein
MSIFNVQSPMHSALLGVPYLSLYRSNPWKGKKLMQITCIKVVNTVTLMLSIIKKDFRLLIQIKKSGL